MIRSVAVLSGFSLGIYGLYLTNKNYPKWYYPVIINSMKILTYILPSPPNNVNLASYT